MRPQAPAEEAKWFLHPLVLVQVVGCLMRKQQAELNQL